MDDTIYILNHRGLEWKRKGNFLKQNLSEIKKKPSDHIRSAFQIWGARETWG